MPHQLPPIKCFAAHLIVLLTVFVSVSTLAQSASVQTQPKVVAAAKVAHAVHAELLAITTAGRRLVAVGDHGVVLMSDDASRSWRQASKMPVDVKLNAVSFVNEKQGWAAGHWGTILHTRDGGDTWDIQRVAASEDRPLFAIHFFDETHGVAVGLWSLVLVTEDGGASWAQQTLAPPPGGKKADLNLLGLFPGANGRVYAVAEKGFVLVSEDLGHTWRYLETGYKGSFWTGVGLPDGTLVVAGLRGSIYRSVDGGKIWARISNSNSSSITTLAASPSELIAGGLEGAVLRSKDGGATFAPQVRPDRIGVTAIAVLPDGTAILVTRAGPVNLAAAK